MRAAFGECIWHAHCLTMADLKQRLLLMGIFAKFAAALVSIPNAVLGGMTTFLFAAVASSGIRIISTMPFTRRNRFILTAALTLGFGATLVPSWFNYVFTYSGDNRALAGFFTAIELVMQTGFAIAGLLALVLNLLLPEEDDDEETPELLANHADDAADREEWDVIKGNRGSTSTPEEEVKSSEVNKV